MKKIYANYIKRQIVSIAIPFGMSVTTELIDYVLSKPISQWHRYLWIIKKTIGCLKLEEMEWLFLFLYKKGD